MYQGEPCKRPSPVVTNRRTAARPTLNEMQTVAPRLAPQKHHHLVESNRAACQDALGSLFSPNREAHPAPIGAIFAFEPISIELLAPTASWKSLQLGLQPNAMYRERRDRRHTDRALRPRAEASLRQHILPIDRVHLQPHALSICAKATQSFEAHEWDGVEYSRRQAVAELVQAGRGL